MFDHTSQFLSGINVTFKIRDLQCKIEKIPQQVPKSIHIPVWSGWGF